MVRLEHRAHHTCVCSNRRALASRGALSLAQFAHVDQSVPSNLRNCAWLVVWLIDPPKFNLVLVLEPEIIRLHINQEEVEYSTFLGHV